MFNTRRVVSVLIATGLIVVACVADPPEPKSADQAVMVPAASGSTAATRPTASTQVAQCQVDSECVPASCCHATSCVPSNQAPSCDNARCTRDCRGGTLDCGGSCACENKQCVAKVKASLFPITK